VNLEFVKRLRADPRLSGFLSILGGLIYLIRSGISAHTQLSYLDEGAYLLKGYLFASGEYWPFQDFGPWTNHMPLSFLIPGWVQELLGPGLRTGRYFAVFLSVVMLVGIWILGRRIGGKWWAAGLVWFFVFNSPAIKTFSVMGSQGLVACILVWILVLTIGSFRPLWQILLGIILAGGLLLTRINLAPVLPILILYIFWENGWKKGFTSTLIGILVVGVGHAFFWPGILRLWAKWLPSNLIPFLRDFQPPANAAPRVIPDVALYNRVVSFVQGMQYHFFAIGGAVFAIFAWPGKKDRKSDWRFRAFVFLMVLFSCLFFIHMWASLWNTYCVYCFKAYLFFFDILGILLVPLTFIAWGNGLNPIRRWFSVPTMIAISLMMAFDVSIVLGKEVITNQIIRKIMTLQLPRMDGFNIKQGAITLWGLLSNKFGWSEDQIFQTAAVVLRRSLPGLIVLIICGGLFYFLVRRSRVVAGELAVRNNNKFRMAPVHILWIMGVVVSLGLGFAPQEADCGWDVISTYEAGGAHLADHVPAGSLIYWNGGLSAVPLLYLPDFQMYPPQINNGYSLRSGGDKSELVRYGWWSEDVSQDWKQEADVFLIEGWREQVDGYYFDELTPTQSLLPCRSKSEIHIYVRR